ncbi:MAG: hypothetical protein V8S23_10650 [Lachnospiraceae bacterium]
MGRAHFDRQYGCHWIANSVIESERSRDTLISTDYVFCGIGASVYTESAGKAVYYPNMVIDFIDKISTL